MFQLSSGPTCKRVTLVLITLFILAGLFACGGSSTKSTPQDGGNTTPPPAVAITATCAQTTVPMGGTTSCSASVSNATDTSVTWKVTEGDTAGTFANGTFTAPAKVAADTTVHLVATSKADTTKTATVTLTVKAASIVASCEKTTVVTGATTKCTATVSGAVDTAYTIAVKDGDLGTFDATKGLYTAPATITDNPTTVNLIATSHADATKTASVALTVKNPIVITVSPAKPDVHIKDTQVFTATVTGAIEDSTLTWAVKEGDVAGKIAVDDAGVVTYTAPDVVTGCTPTEDGSKCVQTVHVVATSKEDTQFTNQATLSVYANAPTYAGMPCPEATVDNMVCLNANQGDLWKYQFAGTDPEGGTLSISMTAQPEGAHIETNSTDTIAWIPTAAESRTSNSFALKAVSTSGAYTTQAWTVIPSGIVSGVMNQKFLSATGTKTTPVDLTGATIHIFTIDENGAVAFDSGAVNGTANGTFEVEKVPGGNYFITASNTWMPNIQSSVSSIDLSSWYLGRTDAKRSSEGTSRKVHFDGLQAWAGGDWMDMSIPNIGEWDYMPDVLPDTITFDSIQTPYFLADASKGDRAYAGQFVQGTSNGGRTYYRLAKSAAFDVTDKDGEQITLTQTFADLTGTTPFQPVILGSKFEALNAATNPNAYTQESELYLATAPFGLDHGYVDYGPELFDFSGWGEQAVTTDVDLGSLTYSNPYPTTWPVFAEYDHYTEVPVDTPDGTEYFGTSIWQLTDAIPTAANGVSPILGPVVGATVNEGDFFEGGTITGPVKLTWEAPEVGTAQAYQVQVADITDWNFTMFQTTATELVVPAELFVAGHNYVFWINAVTSTDIDMNVTPLQKGFPYAEASAISGSFTVEAAPAPTATGARLPKLNTQKLVKQGKVVKLGATAHKLAGKNLGR